MYIAGNIRQPVTSSSRGFKWHSGITERILLKSFPTNKLRPPPPVDWRRHFLWSPGLAIRVSIPDKEIKLKKKSMTDYWISYFCLNNRNILSSENQFFILILISTLLGLWFLGGHNDRITWAAPLRLENRAICSYTSTKAVKGLGINKMVQDSTVETQLIMWCSIYC